MPQKEAIRLLNGVAAPLLTVATVSGDSTGLSDEQVQQQIDSNSPWVPRQWIQTPMFIMQHQEYSPSTPVTRIGGQVIFEIPKNMTLIEDMVLKVILPPLVGGVGTTFLYWVDFLGFAMMNEMKVMYSNNTNYTVQRWSWYRQYAKWLENEQKAAIDQIIYGNTSTAQRSALAANGGTLYIPLLLPSRVDTSNALPMVTLAQKLKLMFNIEALANLIQTDSPTAVAQNGQIEYSLLVNAIHTTGSESVGFYNKCQRAQGISYMIHEPVIQNVDSFANTTNNVELRAKIVNISRPLQIIYWFMIPDNLINNTGTNDFFMYNPNPPLPIPPGMAAYNPPTQWRIEANGVTIQDRIDIDFVRWYLAQKYHKGQAGEYLLFQTYTLAPEAINAALGYMDYGNLSNPTLFIQMGLGGTGTFGGQPQSIRVFLEGVDYNWWFFQGGDFTKSFT
jgi:hypothetical protein